MILDIDIDGLGVIDRASLPLGPGFTALTGETGAGKTMVVSALGLLLGGRAGAMTVSERTQGRWLEFARTGRPGWPAYEKGRRRTLLIDRMDTVAEDPDREMRELWGEGVVGFS